MTIEIRITIDPFANGGAAHKYHATPEELEQNAREILIQAERDKRARERAFGNSTPGNQEPEAQAP
jgi:hypothetical protein